MAQQVPFDSPFYPYERDQTGYLTFRGWEDIPYKVITYLLDLPDANGYQPVDDNNRPRVRLAKYLWYDGARPLAQPLPTPAQKRSMLFDPDTPVLNTDEQKAKHPVGYRIFPQNSISQSQLNAEAIMYCYIGRDTPYDNFHSRTALIFEFWVNTNYAANTKTSHYTRLDAIEQALKESLIGVNIGGVGTIQYSQRFHPDCGSRALWDNHTDVGRELIFAFMWAESGPDDGRSY